MNNINPNNYPGITATVVGTAGGEARFPLYDKEGKRGRKEVSVAVGHGYRDKDGNWQDTSTTWVSYEAGGDYVATLEEVRKGDKIRLDEVKFETRLYKNKDGEEKIGVTATFGTLTILERDRMAYEDWLADNQEGSDFEDTDDEAPW